MAEYPTYSTGTVSISNGDTSVVGSGTGWTDTDARAGDLIQIGTAQPVEIRDRTDSTHLTLWAGWAAGTVSGGTYKVIKKSPSRFNATATMIEVSETFRAMNTDGYYFYVSSLETEPNPSYGNDGQFAMQATTGKLWLKEGGVWVYIGINKGFSVPLPWSSAKAYVAYDVASLAGSTYVCILAHTNHAPPNATYWTLLASKGDPGPVSYANGIVLPQGRLTLTSGVSITTADVAGATSIYWTPVGGNRVPIWDGSQFLGVTFSELTLALDANTGHTGYLNANRNWDVFVILIGGSPRLAVQAFPWETDFARGYAGALDLALVNGGAIAKFW